MVGAAARLHNQRLSTHPSHFVQLGSPEPALLARSLADLELNSKVDGGGGRREGDRELRMTVELRQGSRGHGLHLPPCCAMHSALTLGQPRQARSADMWPSSLPIPSAPTHPSPAQVFDLMGYAPSHVNKINIHVGALRGSKAHSLACFAAAVDRLSPACRARLTGVCVPSHGSGGAGGSGAGRRRVLHLCCTGAGLLGITYFSARC